MSVASRNRVINFYDIDNALRIICVSVHGNWSAWAEWSDCSASCGGGIQGRRRYCINPPPKNGGRDCSGKGYDVQRCNTQGCPGKVPNSWCLLSFSSGNNQNSGRRRDHEIYLDWTRLHWTPDRKFRFRSLRKTLDSYKTKRFFILSLSSVFIDLKSRCSGLIWVTVEHCSCY